MMFELDNWRDHQWEHHHKFSSSWLDSNQNYRFTRSGTGSRGNQVGGGFTVIFCFLTRIYSHVCLFKGGLQAFIMYLYNGDVQSCVFA